MFVDPKVAEYFSSEAVLYKVNGDIDTAVARRFCVSGFPTLVMLGSDGNEIDRVAGYLPPDEFLQTFRDYGKGIGTLASMVGKAKDSVDRNLYMQIAEKYKYGCDKAAAVEWYGKVIAAGKPTDSLSGVSRMELADILRRAKKYDSAVLAYQKVAKDFKKTSFASDADWYLGDVYRRMKDTAKAIKAFETWMTKYPKADTSEVSYTKGLIEKLKNPPAPKPEEKK
ncbi:hypothetical protein C3F09_10240 [candidate division GN15 bacterium]|uniref:Ancillary SecYEG translocon subunit/Cell division coordinator CpoB TPR domain-containing protein n=1 Tax=candidate division GN15 bacterium TaxID=2072418 RepID=A0A855X4C0_9BACT|nr:MAG: hypothetical protein C3F09_10240 [candidate division GN15 bacterium]